MSLSISSKTREAFMQGKSYYGTNRDWVTCLEFYSRQKGCDERVVFNRLEHQEAYDMWYLAIAFKEILEYRRLLKKERLTFEDLPRKEKNMLLYLILKTCPRFKAVVELGSSLLELIDGLELANRYFATHGASTSPMNIKSYKFIGIEISDLLSQGSLLLHPAYDITLLDSCNKLSGRHELLYDRAVSSYAFTSASELADFISSFDVALLNLFISRGDTFISSAVGKSFTYFSLKELLQNLQNPLYHLFGYKSPTLDKSIGRSVVEGFFLYGPNGFAADFMKTSKAIPQAEKYFKEKKIELKEAAALLNTQ